MNDLQKIKENAQANYKLLQKQCLSKVVRWVYAAGPLFSFRPMFNEILGRKPGREIQLSKKAKIKYGFDAGGRLIYLIDNVYKDGGIFHEELLVWEGGNTYLAHFNISYSLLYKTWSTHLEWIQGIEYDPEGRVTRFISGDGQSKYIWQDSMLARIEHEGRNGVCHEELAYDAIGRLDKVWQVWGKQKTLKYKRPPEGISLKSLEQLIHKRLLVAITKMVETAKLRQPSYCLVLAYDGEGNDVLPPCIGIGLGSERKKWTEEKGKVAKDFIWNPAEFTHYEKPYTQLKDEELEKACGLFNDLLRPKENYSPAVKLLVDMAVELSKIEWKYCLETTSDFVVYAVDFELDDLNKNLKKSVPAERLAGLKKSGFL